MEAVFLAVLGVLGLTLCANAQERKDSLVTFDAPGAGTGGGEGTFPFAITPSGVVTGYYCDAITCHGFVRAENGAITAFDLSGDVNGTYPQSINPTETITGFYCDGITCHGFWRTAAGDITTFDVQDAVQGTFAYNINAAGAIAGNYVDANGVSHGFVRAPDGTVATFDAPGAGTSSGQGTFTTFTDGLNPAGELAGYYTDSTGGNHSFVRAPDGAITTFDVPGAVTGTGFHQGTLTAGIDPQGTVSGNYFDGNFATHGYLRAPDGTIVKYDVPGAGSGNFQGTVGAAINPAGALASYWVDDNNIVHGYLRTQQRTIVKFDVSGGGTGPFQGTFPFVIGSSGAIAGYYVDDNNAAHGFLLLGAQ